MRTRPDHPVLIWLGCVGRLIPGGALIIAAALKAVSSQANPLGGVLHGPGALAAALRDHGVLPAFMLAGAWGWSLGLGIMVVELALGVLVLVARGRGGSLAAIGVAALLLAFQVYLAAVAFVAEQGGNSVACWCFGGLGGTTPTGAMLRNAVLIACLVPGMMWPGPTPPWRALLPASKA